MAGLPEFARNMAVWSRFKPVGVWAVSSPAFGPFRARWRRLGRFSPVGVFGSFERLKAVWSGVRRPFGRSARLQAFRALEPLGTLFFLLLILLFIKSDFLENTNSSAK